MCTLKATEDIVSIWNANAHARDMLIRIRNVLIEALGLYHVKDTSYAFALEYRPHDQSMKTMNELHAKEVKPTVW